MTILHERFDASAIEAEIATLEEQRHKLKTLKDADADLKWEPWPTPAALRIDQKLNELRNARDSILAGDVTAVKERPSPPRRVLRMPTFFADKLEVKEQPNVARKGLKVHQDELAELIQGYFDAGTMRDVEETIVEIVEDFKECDSEHTFTQSVYMGLVKNCAVLQAMISGSLHFQLNRRHEIEDRLTALEARPTMTYMGVWAADREYLRGNVVTYDGSSWVANETSMGEIPGKGSAFTLAVKRGRDGRER